MLDETATGVTAGPYAAAVAPAPNDLSIVIPTFNRVNLLKTTIESALAQTMMCEVVVVDHGSTDATPQLAASYGSRINYIRRERDDGPCIAWLDGVLRANGALVHVNFDDDWIAPSFAEKTVAALTEDVGVVFTNATIVAAAHENFLFDPAALTTGKHDSRRLIRYLLDAALTISPGCATFRRRDALDALMMNPAHPSHGYHGAGPDLQMFLTALSRYPSCYYVNEPLAFFRAHDASITSNALQDNGRSQGLANAYSEYKLMFLMGLFATRLVQPHVGEAVKVMLKQVTDAKIMAL